MAITGERRATGSEAARRAMIDSQLRPSGVNEPWVLAAVAALPREEFVPAAMREAAYIDRAIDLGKGRFLAAPLVHARMLAEAAPTPDDAALLVGEGRGYLAALLRPLVGTLEVIDPAAFAPAGLGIAVPADARPYAGRFGLIVVDGAAEALPAKLTDHLVDGGRIVTGLVERGVTRLAAGRRAAGGVALLPLAEIGIPVLAEFAAPRRWSF